MQDPSERNYEVVIGFATFVASTLCMLRFGLKEDTRKSLASFQSSEEDAPIIIKKEVSRTTTLSGSNIDENTTSMSPIKFPWEPDHSPLKASSTTDAPLLCTFISTGTSATMVEHDKQSTEDKLKFISTMSFTKGNFNVACPCCQ